MRANRSRDTSVEIALRRELHRRGLRYFVHRQPLPGLRRTADLVFPRARVAVFVDGCFWHGCPEHHTVAKTNAGFWAEKVERNRKRDRETDTRLRNAGWTVVRLWEHTGVREASDRVSEVLQILRTR
jgi:DNA mismatch endonuclease (patch repair protein)